MFDSDQQKKKWDLNLSEKEKQFKDNLNNM